MSPSSTLIVIALLISSLAYSSSPFIASLSEADKSLKRKLNFDSDEASFKTPCTETYFLAKKKSNNDQKAVFNAIESGLPEDVTVLRETLNKLKTAELITQAGWSILHLAALKGNLEAVKIISKSHPALLFHKTKKGALPIHLAMKRCHLKTIEYMLYCERNLMSALDSNNRTLIFSAFENNSFEVISIIMYFTNEEERSALRERAAFQEKIDLIGVLDLISLRETAQRSDVK